MLLRYATILLAVFCSFQVMGDEQRERLNTQPTPEEWETALISVGQKLPEFVLFGGSFSKHYFRRFQYQREIRELTFSVRTNIAGKYEITSVITALFAPGFEKIYKLQKPAYRAWLVSEQYRPGDDPIREMYFVELDAKDLETVCELGDEYLDKIWEKRKRKQ